MEDTSTGPVSIPPQTRFWKADPTDPPPKQPRGQRIQEPMVSAPPIPIPPERSAGLFYNGFIVTIIGTLAGIIGVAAPEGKGAFFVAGPAWIIGSLMIAVALYRALRSIDYLARERFDDLNG